MRYDTYMMPAKDDIQPGIMICVDCLAQKDGGGDRINGGEASLKSWHLASAFLDGGKYWIRDFHEDINAFEFWRVLRSMIDAYKHPWVMSANCLEAWQLLGLWDEIECGEVSIAERDERIPKGRFRRKTERPPGFIIMEETPNIMCFHLAETKRSAMWTDLRNYGIERPRDVQRGGSTAVWLLEFFMQAWEVTQRLKLGSWRATVGSQAFNGWRASYCNTGIYCHCDQIVLAMESQGYYGGRCEAFRIGKLQGEFHAVDFRSMYPAVYTEIALPVRLCGYTENEFTASDMVCRSPRNCLAEVTVVVDEPLYPFPVQLPLDVRAVANGKCLGVASTVRETEIIYPIGEFRAVLAGPELEDALNHNCVTEIHKVAWYELEKCLNEYGNTVYAERCRNEYACNAVISSYVKRLLVCIVGRFATRDRIWRAAREASTDVYYGSWLGMDESGNQCRYRSIAGDVQRLVEIGWGANSSPGIAAWITSEGRCRLLQAMRQAGFGEVLYIDTDGIIVSAIGYKRLEQADMIRECELGFLRHMQTSNEVFIYGIKDYEMGKKRVHAGVRREAVDGPSPSLYCLNGRNAGKNNSQPRRLSTVRGPNMLASHDLYRHGVVNENGTVRPWQVNLEGKIS